MLEIKSCPIQNIEFTQKTNKQLNVQHRPSAIKSYYVNVGEESNPIFLYVEESGNPKGIPAIFVHGGPGSTFKSTDHQWFDPEKYRIILFQQRGTHRCIPSAEDLHFDVSYFKDVGIDTLAKDMESIRKSLNIDQWLVFGGSWGSMLSLYYAEHYPTACTGLILNGVFQPSNNELTALFSEEKLDKIIKKWNHCALERLYSYASQKAASPTPKTMYSIYRKLIVEKNDITAARLWTAFSKYIKNPDDEVLNRILRENLVTTPTERTKGVWETQLFNDIMTKKIGLIQTSQLKKLIFIPIKIVHGMKDPLCPPADAVNLTNTLHNMGCQVNLSLITDGEHSPYSHPGIIDALVTATDKFALSKSFKS